MNLYLSLKSVWKKLGINGQVINYSSKELWVIETTNGPVAHILYPGYKTSLKIDIDGFKRVAGKSIEKHNNWWKFYDFSTVDVFDHEIDNARPIFPKKGRPYIRSKRDNQILNNLSLKGQV